MSNPSRCDASGRAYAGSQRWIQHHVNQDNGVALSSRIGKMIGLAPEHIRWTSPLAGHRYMEYRDEQFLEAIGHKSAASALRGFWPRRGPCWDALAQVATPMGAGALLIEAKSYPGEVRSGGCKASPASLNLIANSLNRTKSWFGAPPGADWTGPLYQAANRLAHLYFLREVTGMPAWMVNVYFVGDPRTPTTESEWRLTLDITKRELALPDALPYVVDLMLPA